MSFWGSNPTEMDTFRNIDHFISNIKCQIFVAKKEKEVDTKKVIKF